MTWLFVLVLVIAVLCLFFAARLKTKSDRGKGFAYRKNPVLFSPAERSFLGVLEQAVAGEFRVFGKVRVADVVSVKAMTDRRAWHRAFNRIRAKHFDFVICSKSNLAVLAVIELDDQSHRQHTRQKRDAFLVALCQAVSLPLIQVAAQHAYSVSTLRQQLRSALGADSATKSSAMDLAMPVAQPAPTPAAGKEPAPMAAAETLPPPAAPETVICPKCSAAMVRRQSRSQAGSGRGFWGCSAFPKCRGILPDPIRVPAQSIQ